MTNRLWNRLLRGPRPLRREDGFGVVELMVASGVMATALVALASVMTTGLTATAYARERQSADHLANQTLEQIRGLPFNTMKAGLADSDLSGNTDSNVTASGCGSSYCFGGEQVAHGVNATIAPLVPHKQTTTVGSATFTVASYVTYYQNNTSSDARRVTVYVSWTSPVKNGAAKTVQVQTILFAACSGTLGLSNHPVCAPAQASFSAASIQTAGSVNISGTVGGIGVDHATLFTGRTVSDQSIEQISRVEGIAQQSGAAIQATGAGEQVVGRTSVSSRADTDPSAPAPLYSTASMPALSSGSASLTSGANTITVNETGGDVGGTTSTTSACTSGCTNPAAPSPRNCPNISGYANESDGNQCGGSSSRTGATVTASANLTTLGSISLAALGPQANPTVATSDRQTTTGGTACPATSGDGCVRTAITRSALDLSAGALPSNLNSSLKPAGFTYFAQITGLADSVSAESGVGSQSPVATQSAGSIKIYCATAIPGDQLCSSTGYVTKTLNQITSVLNTPTLTLTDAQLGGGTQVQLSATITPGSMATTQSCSGTCTRTAATATSTPPTVSVSYTISVAGTTVVNATLVLDPGALTARTSYAPAPTS
jgi:hypothetical protein